MQVIAFDKDRLIEEPLEHVHQLKAYLEQSTVTWLNVDGLGDANTIRQIGELFGFHPLALEDVINVHQRAKVERYGEHLYIVTRLVTLTAEQMESEQISIFLGRNFVVTFQQRSGDCFDPVRERIRTRRGRIRGARADYLAYALIDAVIDSYFPVVEQFADHLEDLDERVATSQSPAVTEAIHGVRNDLLLLRRSIRPHRDALNELVRDQDPLIVDETRLFLRDCYDHTVQLIDLLDVYREMCSDLRDYYLSLVSNRMNDVMKVLTIIATIFIPLSFVAGLYGMNFNTQLPGNMPELNWPYGYLAVISVMVLIAFTMLLYFWRRGWIGPAKPPPYV
jgi:magnesium transporter